MIAILQLLAGIAWLLPLILFSPAIVRIWRAPWTGPARPDPVDVLVSPLAFVGALHVGFTIRWLLFPHAIVVMTSLELGLWAGLYVLSIIAAACSVLAWRIARRIG